MSQYRFETSCVDCPNGRWINDMTDQAFDLTYDTMRRLLGEQLITWAIEHGYDRRPPGLTLRQDWSVSYHRSKYRGRDCLYVKWSAIEFIFVRTE